MADKRISASRFKERCLALLDEVARTKAPLVVTKRGEPVARVVPLDEPKRKPLRDSVTFLAEDEDELFSTGERWDAEGA